MISDGPSLLRLATFVNGYPFKPDQLGDRGLPVIRIRHLIDPTAEPELATPPDAAVIIDDGDLVFSWSATLAVRPWNRGRALLNQHLFRVDPARHVDRSWLRFVLSVAIDRLQPLMHGSAMTHITQDMLRVITVSVPSPQSQREIADFLDAETARIDALIASKHALRRSLEERRSALIELAVRKLAGTWGEQPLRFATAEITVGIVVTPAAWYADEGVPAVRGLDVSEGRISTDDLVQITHEGHVVHRKSRLRAGDVVVVRTGQAGRAAVVPAELDGSNCIDLLIVRPGRHLDSKFLEFVLNSDWTQKYVERYSVGTIQSHFNVAGLRALGVPRAPLSEQRAAVVEMTGATETIGAVIDCLDKQIALLQEHRQALITAAVTGELDIPGAAA